jgi:DNA invertase Pin-like site-specific DNA recombinase
MHGLYGLAMAKKPQQPGPPNPLNLIGYARVSTEDQKLDLQLHALRAAGVPDADIHVEKVSGNSKRRPELDLAIKALRPGDQLVVWRLDRIARNVRELYRRIDAINEQEASFHSLTERFDFTTATGKLILGFLGLMADFERQLTIERTTAGIAAWKARGGKPGRQIVFTKDKQAKARAMVKQGMTIRAVAAKMGVSSSLLHQRGIKRSYKRTVN